MVSINTGGSSSRLDAADELGKSLAKIMQSEKYNQFTYNDCKFILEIASAVAVKILEQEGKKEQQQQ